MASLDDAARNALQNADSLLASVEHVHARYAEIRDRVTQAQARLDSDWTTIRERTRAFLDHVVAETQRVGAAKATVHGALTGLRGGLADLHSEASRGVEQTRASFDDLAAELGEIEDHMTAVLAEADDAETSLRSRVEVAQTEVEETMAESFGLVRGALVDEVTEAQEEIENDAVELAAFISGECAAAIAARSRELFDQLVETEQELRSALEDAASATEDAANRTLSTCADTFEIEMRDLEDVASSVTDLLSDLEDAVADGRRRLEDRRDRWEDAVRRTREDLREAADLLKDVEAYLHRFGFAR